MKKKKLIAIHLDTLQFYLEDAEKQFQPVWRDAKLQYDLGRKKAKNQELGTILQIVSFQAF